MKTRRYCRHCGRMLTKSRIKGYAFQCMWCDEDFYRIEVLRWKKERLKIICLRKKRCVHQNDKWWYSLDFQTMERITGYRQFDFDPEGGYQAFVDVCDNWWETLSTKEKTEIKNEYE